MSKEHKEGGQVANRQPIENLRERITLFNSNQENLLDSIAETESRLENTQEIDPDQRRELSSALNDIKTLNNQIESRLQSLIHS